MTVRPTGGPLRQRGSAAVHQQRAREALAEKREQLRRQNDRLEFLNHLVRHDIANELTIAGGVLQSVQTDAPPAVKRDLEQAIDAIDKAAGIADAAGDLVEVFAQGASIDQKPVTLAPIVRAEVDDASASHPEAEIEIEGELPETSVLANELLDSVIRNLLSNAVHHNDADPPKVVVRVGEHEEFVRLQVADNGPGVPTQIREAIFEYENQRQESAGMGIGLHLVATLVDAYGGTIDIEENEPRGAVFTVDLPRA